MSTTPITKDSAILIVGAGTFGLSTALDLARRGFSNVTCFDKYECPSPIAAGNDSNKMVEYEYYAPEETPHPGDRMRLESLELWKTDPIFNPHYHPVGFIYAASSKATLDEKTERVQHLLKHEYRDYEYLDTPEKFKKHIPVLTGDLPGWRGYFLNQDDGWLEARNAFVSTFRECKRLGVKFTFGADGDIGGLLEEEGNALGIVTKNGKQFRGDRIVITAGANAISVLDFKDQIQAKCFTLAHIKVTEEEAEKFKGLPVMFNFEKGFFFEADENLEIKICNEFPGYTNLDSEGRSVPFFTEEIPVEAEEGVRQYLRETIPEFADREFVKTRSCWCTDSPNRELILSEHPDYSNVILGTGDSGKSFMLMPVIGKYISRLVEAGTAGLTEKDAQFWKWRPETAGDRDDQQARYGGSGVVTDIKTIADWVSASNPKPHTIF
ncbi:unnamed protein product [Kuraishia capsulata CBS 1993]|uniref:FAD dependent oxidoreductase domain-containing protein n=1 Tax=Kuraishia capsulata CBS 1993 TaxID=1382522 RepID=W6MIH5_9ASCO|nr:uncharacterized protein KUCA_T00002240001 [Kuraishia capsulata CBS 1993]CDK26269.1 unnamed protein product [Kuraishia capsulata CBS 1993]